MFVYTVLYTIGLLRKHCGTFLSKSNNSGNVVYMSSIANQTSWVIKLFSCSTQLSMKFILLINVKMATIVGISAFMCRINTTSERLNPINFFICRYFIFYAQLKFQAPLS